MLDSLTLPPLPTLPGERVILRGPRDFDVDDRLRYPIDPEEEDCYGSSWRREWDGRRYHTREYLTAASSPPNPRTYTWMVEYDGYCIGSAGLDVNPGQHSAEYTVASSHSAAIVATSVASIAWLAMRNATIPATSITMPRAVASVT